MTEMDRKKKKKTKLHVSFNVAHLLLRQINQHRGQHEIPNFGQSFDQLADDHNV